ncbi:hypothetical protein [Novosphingobium sediminicola]|uniref:Glycosyltransferase RgtA/B/C/D-like domain-containing protein n=1 Tax=Novosphingobium sediminicola TaxID=563162 RepID=A0A7W6CFE0_9SPHN|nr:hypothetical protein [Novosphingobium sediminicola]
MGGVAYRLDGVNGRAPAPYDRFAAWGRWPARLALAVLALLLAASAWVPLTVGRGEEAKAPNLVIAHNKAAERPRDEDLKLYDRAIARILHGENYYDFIVSEHRRADYPVRPGAAVRLPTLAYLDAAMGVDGDRAAPIAMAAAVALMIGVIAAWWGRLGDLGVDPSLRRIGTALVFFGASLGLNRYYFVLHELWAGMLVALSLGLHRPSDRKVSGRWVGAVLAAALALSIREHVLPYVLLMGAMAGWRGAWREAAAWGVLVALFAVGYAWHLHLIALQTLPTDRVGPSWLALRGLGGFLSNTVLSSNLRFLPHQIAGPLTILMIFGWASWRSSAGLTGLLLFSGYALLFSIAGRNDNFYWGAVITPVMALGLAFVPMGVGALVRGAFKK